MMNRTPRQVTPNELNRQLQAALEAIAGANIKRGHLRLYLGDEELLPLVTIEDDEDLVKHAPGSKSFSHKKTWRIRATIKAGPESKPDEALNTILTDMRIALLRHPTLNVQAIELAEYKPASFELPEPGLPLACATLHISASFNELL